jgi:hypothetical protein
MKISLVLSRKITISVAPQQNEYLSVVGKDKNYVSCFIIQKSMPLLQIRKEKLTTTFTPTEEHISDITSVGEHFFTFLKLSSTITSNR